MAGIWECTSKRERDMDYQRELYKHVKTSPVRDIILNAEPITITSRQHANTLASLATLGFFIHLICQGFPFFLHENVLADGKISI